MFPETRTSEICSIFKIIFPKRTAQEIAVSFAKKKINCNKKQYMSTYLYGAHVFLKFVDRFPWVLRTWAKSGMRRWLDGWACLNRRQADPPLYPLALESWDKTGARRSLEETRRIQHCLCASDAEKESIWMSTMWWCGCGCKLSAASWTLTTRIAREARHAHQYNGCIAKHANLRASSWLLNPFCSKVGITVCTKQKWTWPQQSSLRRWAPFLLWLCDISCLLIILPCC